MTARVDGGDTGLIVAVAILATIVVFAIAKLLFFRK